MRMSDWSSDVCSSDLRYLKDDQEEADFMLQLALKEASLIPSDGAAPISEGALAELARQYIMADSVINRLARTIDMSALSAMAEGVEINLDSAEQAHASAPRLQDVVDDPALPVAVTVITEQAATMATTARGEAETG